MRRHNTAVPWNAEPIERSRFELFERWASVETPTPATR